MNRILIQPSEAGPDGLVRWEGRRARHVREVLRARPGRRLRVGLLDGPLGTAEVLSVDADSVRVRCVFEAEPPPRSPVDVLLALPRPKALKRLWSALASVGVDRIWLVRAARVERHYFDTHWLTPAYYRPLLIEGLELSGDTRLPTVEIVRRFKPFVEDELDARAPGTARWLAHPGARLNAIEAPLDGRRRVLVAVGPEGGWTEYELARLEARGFVAVNLGWRRLRSETACVALVVLAHQRLEQDDHERATASAGG